MQKELTVVFNTHFPMTIIQHGITLICALAAATATVKAQNCVCTDYAPTHSDTMLTTDYTATTHYAGGDTEHQWLWGAGRANVLDTYLSPLEYTGLNLAVQHRTERMAHWGGGHVTVQSLYGGHAAYMKSPTDDGKEWDAELTAAGGLLYNWMSTTHWRFAAGGTVEGSGGFTYNTRGSNNPAQGRLGVSLNASALAEYRFKLWHRMATARVLADVQIAGVQFAPEYGQSYYEIFSLGHTDGIIHFTHPGNCPSARLQATLTLPVAGAKVTLGYLADIRQSKLGGLKRHAWRNNFMIGYTRHLRLMR